MLLTLLLGDEQARWEVDTMVYGIPSHLLSLSNKLFLSRLTIVSREAKKKQRAQSDELFTWTTTKKLENAQAKQP